MKFLLKCLAGLCALWAVFAFLTFRSDAHLNSVASAIARGEPFKKSALAELRPALDEISQGSLETPESLHDAALVELRLADIELETGHPIAGNPQFEQAQKSIEHAARLVPSDASLWFALFWLSKMHEGMNNKALAYLRMSYRVGPHEGWIALRRNRITVSLIPSLPADVGDLVIAEFDNIVASGFNDAAAEIVTGPGWGLHEQLLASLSNVPDEDKQQLANAIYNRGFDVVIPGLQPRGLRPWR